MCSTLMTEPCECGWLSLHINEPRSAIRFDEQMNCFVIDSSEGQAVMHFCPGCGGKLPDSTKPVWVPLAPQGERERLEALTIGLSTADQVLARLGAPDYDEVGYTYWQRDGRMVRDETTPPFRNIEYYGLSDWYNLEFYICDDGRIKVEIMIKSLPPRQMDEA